MTYRTLAMIAALAGAGCTGEIGATGASGNSGDVQRGSSGSVDSRGTQVTYAPAYVPRLTQAEYVNGVRDLLGDVAATAAEKLDLDDPVGESDHTFRTMRATTNGLVDIAAEHVSTTAFDVAHPAAGYHAITHMDKSIAMPAIHEVTLWKMQKLAQFIGYLKAVPEGAGTLLDNCLVFASSEMDDATTHFCINTPMILAGKAGGGLKTGLHYAGFVGKEPYANGDNDTNQESTTKVLLTILRALGEKDSQWGQRSEKNGPAITEPFGALLA